MGSKARKQQLIWYAQPLTPLMEGPDPEMLEEGNKKESSWEIIREWFRLQKGFQGNMSFSTTSLSSSSSSCSTYGATVNNPTKGQNLRLLLGVLGCPLAPIPLPNHPIHDRLLHVKDIPLETSIAHYIIQQYLAATGCLKQQKCSFKNMYASGTVKMIGCETEVCTGGRTVKSLGTRSGEIGCFVLWQMKPGMWSFEVAVGGNKVLAGSDGKTVWRHTPWLGSHAAKGPQRPLRRIIQVSEALRKAGLESSNLIVGIDFTKSNEWTGKVSFNNHSLHAIGDTPNPYEKAISIIGKTLAPFDEDNLIPCFGFGDATTRDETVFSFHSDHSPCHGFEDVLSCYRRIVPDLRLSGPTSYAPVVEAAIDIVEKSGGQYHVLVIITDGQVTRSVNTSDSELSPQEEKTIKSFVDASSYPLSIILVGVGYGPSENMRNFDDKIPARDFDNFQFVNFIYIMSKSTSPAEKEAAFALAALMEIPIQYKAALEFRLLGRVTGKAKKIVPRPPPVPYTYRVPPTREPSHLSGDTQTTEEQSQTVCPICLTNGKDLAFNCGHMTCRECGTRVSLCPICRQPINSRLRVYTG